MPSKSMSPMPMQTKIGDASLKFGPDWLRALSSDNSTGGAGALPSGGSSGGGWSYGSGGGGGSGERSSTNERNSAFHSQSSTREKEPDRRYVNNTSNHSALPVSRFKLSEFRYTREELLTLYDKNLQAPDYLASFGTLFIEKMQPPLAFSQPSEEELRTWHVPQPESSRQSCVGPVVTGLSSLSRGGGFAARGRGSVDRGRGRGGRGGYYGGGVRPHEEEDRSISFRSHAFSRSLSAHERNWVPERERNGLAGSPPESENSRGGGGGNWRNRNSDSYPKSRYEEADDGWRNKQRWRREEEEDYAPRSNTRRIHKSWSDDGTQDNLPEWAKDNPSEESGTFDSSGAFHDEDRYSAKTNAFELSRRSDQSEHGKDPKQDHPHGSQNERVQKRTSERAEGKSVPPNPLREEEEEDDSFLNHSRHNVSPLEPENPKDETPKPETPTQNHTKSLSSSPPTTTKRINEDHYFSMIEEADSLVAKLIEEDAASASVRLLGAAQPIVPPVSSVSSNAGTPQGQPTAQVGSCDIWFYRDPQGNVQGPFGTAEMSLWLNQGYFTGSLFLRRECDNIFISLSDMGKLYCRNPFVPTPDAAPTPPPIQDPVNGTSALDPLGGENVHTAQAQFIQKQHQLFQAQQHQYLLNFVQQSERGGRKENEGWGNVTPTSAQLQQAQLLLNMAKSAGVGGTEGTALDHLQSLFQRQMQVKGPDKKPTEFRPTNIPPQNENVSKSSADLDPIQSLLHQLTSMSTNSASGLKSSGGGGIEWGAGGSVNSWPIAPVTVPPSNSLWDYREQYLKIQQIKAEELVTRKKLEEEQERKRLQEEEESRKRVEEQKRLELEQEQKRKAYEELLQQQAAAAAELTRQREEMILQQRMQQQELARQRLEQERQLEKQRLEQLQKLEQQRLEQQRLEQQRIEQARIEKEREEERERAREREREEQERRVQVELEEQRRREERRLQQEAQLKKLQELQQQQAQLQKMPWNTTSGSKAPRTLLEIQEEEALQYQREETLKVQAFTQKKAEEEQRLSQQAKGLSLKWAAQPLQPQKLPIKSLAEIQAEEAASLEEKRREKEIQTRHLNLQQQWTSNLTWANRASINASTVCGKANGGGVWEEGRKKWEGENPPLVSNKQTGHSGGKAGKERTKDLSADDSFLKLFQDHGLSLGRASVSRQGADDSFTRWCFETVEGIGGSVDVPTFINFLKEVESPFEVNDYIRSYLGDGKEARDFGREFLERRSRWKNARRGGEKEGKSFEDNLCRPAFALNPPNAEFQEVKGKKGKKGKMQKVDARILGFNTTAAPDRLNVGKRDYGDGSDN